MIGARPAGPWFVVGETLGMTVPAATPGPLPRLRLSVLVGLSTVSPSAISWPNFATGHPLAPHACPMEQPSMLYRLLQATMELDDDYCKGGGRRAANAAQALQALVLPPKRQRSNSPPGAREALQRPPLAPGSEAAGSHEGEGARTESRSPKAGPRPTATKSGPPQPPDVLAATSKAKPAKARALQGPGEGTFSSPTAQRPPQEEDPSEYYSTSESPSSDAAPQGNEKQASPQKVKGQQDMRAPFPPCAGAGP